MNVDDFSQGFGALDIDDGRRNKFAAFEPQPPEAPDLQRTGVVAMEITEQFSNAAQHLEVGQLIKDPFFTLFESVGALEIMDKKMDSGYLEPGETMDDEYDFGESLLPEEIIGIIDQLLSHEMAWHMGHPLAQTLLTSLHIDRILSPCPVAIDSTYFDRSESCSVEEPLMQQVLRAYCLGLIKTCFYVNARVLAEHFYEEEDFVTHTFNRNLLEGIELDAIIQFIEETRESLSHADDLVPHFKTALDHRLQFRALFLKAVESADLRTSTEKVKALWTELLHFLPSIKSSTALGKHDSTAFSVKIQRKLASTVPPRPIVEVSMESAFDHLERLCLDASVAVEVLRYYDSHSLMAFVSIFQARKPQPSVYVRTLLQHYLFSDMVILGTISVRQVLDDDFSSIVMPSNILLDKSNDEIELPHDPRFKMAELMEAFRCRAAASYLDILRILCQNRCRIRRSLTHTIVDWDSLQLDAEELDVELRGYTKEEPIINTDISEEPIYSFPLSSWAYFHKIRQMEWTVQMGFELEIYQPDELAEMYWYLQYLAKTRSRHLERIRGFIVRNYAASRRNTKDTGQKNAEYANALAFVNFSSMEAAATYAFADALSCLFAVLNRLSLVPSPERPYSNDQLRYEIRMKPFMSIGLPELVPFHALRRFVEQPEESTLNLLNFAADSVMGAKKGFEVLSKLTAKEAFCRGSHDSWLKNIKNCLKACIFTGISISATKKAVEAAGKEGHAKIKAEIPLVGKGYHDWWTVPKITPIP